MNVALVGYGKMGKTVEKLLLEKKIVPKAIIDPFSTESMYKEVDNHSLKNIDVVIEFASKEKLLERVKCYVENKVNVVMGTTGWYDSIEEVKKIVGNKIGFIWSGNYSIGVNVFFKIIKEASKIFNKLGIYDPLLYEIHHNEKKDSPSGTSKMIEKILLEELNSKKRIVEEKLDRKIEKEEIHSASVRGGWIPGIHVVMFDSPDDTIELKHSARNREGFARGSILAAEWIYGKKGFFDINDFINELIK